MDDRRTPARPSASHLQEQKRYWAGGRLPPVTASSRTRGAKDRAIAYSRLAHDSASAAGFVCPDSLLPLDWQSESSGRLLKQAARDLEAAENSAAAGYHEWAAFGAQQSAEKAVKAVVQSRNGAARGHSITGMLEQLAAFIEVPDSIMKAAMELDQVYVTSRYPNGFVSGSPGDYFSEQTSKRLIGHAREILEFCRSQVH